MASRQSAAFRTLPTDNEGTVKLLKEIEIFAIDLSLAFNLPNPFERHAKPNLLGLGDRGGQR